MKILIGRFIFFMAVAVLSYCMLVLCWADFVPLGFLKKNYVYPKGDIGFSYTRLAEVDTVNNIDVLFLGSSHSFRGFDTRIYNATGLSSFNLGSPSQTPIQTRILIEQYLDQLNPKLVVYEVYPATFQNDGVESTLDLIANSECLHCYLEMTLKVNHIKAYNALIYDSFASFLGLNKDFREARVKGSDIYVNGGFVESEVTKNESPVTDKMRQNWDRDTWEFKDQQWVEFLEILEVLEKRGVAVELIQMPVTKAAYTLYKNNEYVDSLFNAHGSYLNFNQVLLLDDHYDFIDYHHLSQTGVEKANQTLLNTILPRHFNDLRENE